MPIQEHPTLARLLIEQVVVEDHPYRRTELDGLAALALERALVRHGGYAAWRERDETAHFDPMSERIPDALEFRDGGLPDEVEPLVRHVVDWLAADLSRNAGWLARTDRDGRPLKLTKIGSLDRAVAEADKAMARARSNSIGAARASAGETIHADMGDGWTIVELGTPEALDVESALMGHCIGNGAYDGRLESGARRYLSLRDPAGRSHVTMEIDRKNDALLQIQGKQNRPPVGRHVVRLLRWLETSVAMKAGDRARIGVVRDEDGRLHHVSDLPDSFSSIDDLSIDLTRNQGRLPSTLLATTGRLSVVAPKDVPTALPATIVAPQGAILHGSFTGLSDCDLSVGGLDMSGSSVGALPETFATNGSVDLTRSDVVRIPPGFTARSLDLQETAVRSLPATMSVGDLFLKDMGTVELPRLLRAYRIEAKRTRLDSVPDGLEAHTLSISDAPPVSFGRDLIVRGRLQLIAVEGTTVVPSDATVGELFASLGSTVEVLPGAKLRSVEIVEGTSLKLPPRTILQGGLVAKRSVLEGDLTGLRVGGDMRLEGGVVEHLPDGLHVGGTLFLDDRSKTMGRGTTIGGDLSIVSSVIDEIPEGTRIGGDVRPPLFSPLARIGADVTVGGTLIPPPALRGIGPRLRVGSLDWRWCGKAALPEGLVVERDLDISGCGIAELPADIVVRGSVLISKDDPEPTIQDRSRIGRLMRDGSSGDEIVDGIFGGRMFSSPVL